MKRCYLIFILLLPVFGMCMSEDFSSNQPAVQKWQSGWELHDGYLRTKDGLSRYSRFIAEVDKTAELTVSFRIKLLAEDAKGGLFGCKIQNGNGMLHLFYQNSMVRAIVSVTGEKKGTQNLTSLPEPLAVGPGAEWVTMNLVISGSKVHATVNGTDAGNLDLPSSWTASPMQQVEFHAYRMDVAIDDIVIDQGKQETSRIDDNAKLVAEPGDERLSQLDVAETTEVVKDEKAFRILFIGDSITRHGFSQKTIQKLGWDHVAGMAASAEDKDYAHLVTAELQARMPERSVHLHFHNKGGSGAARHRLSTIDEFAELQPHLVIVQLGEHEKEHAGIEALQRDYGALLAAIQGWKPTPQIICTGVWNPYKAGERTAYTAWSRQVEDTMKGICNAKGIPFASVEQVALDPAL